MCVGLIVEQKNILDIVSAISCICPWGEQYKNCIRPSYFPWWSNGCYLKDCLKDVEASLRDEGTEEDVSDVSIEDATPVSELSEMVREINEDL